MQKGVDSFERRERIDNQRNVPRQVGAAGPPTRGGTMLPTILVIILILMLIGFLPAWPYNRDWGYSPFTVVGLVFVIVLVLLVLGKF
jgi:hypothetical protein